MSSSEWKEFAFPDFVDINPPIRLQSSKEYSFVEMKDLNDGQRKVFPSAMRKLSGGARFQNGDTLFARITPCLENGKICQVEGLKDGVGFGSTEFLVLRGKERISDNDFVFYLSRSSEVRRFAEQHLIGTSGRQRVGKEAFANLRLLMPPYETQQHIASILTSLDDKIELNRQTNQTLEEIAKTLFQEMCVPKGDELPEGWRVGNILEIADLLSGGTPKTEMPQYWGGEVNWISAKDIAGNNKNFIIETEKNITETGLKKSAAKLLPTLTTIVTARGTVGNYCILSREMAISQSNYGLKSKTNADFFIFSLVESMMGLMKQFSYGTIFDTITTKTFKEMSIAIPSEDIIKQFETVVKPIFLQKLYNQEQIQTLTASRNSLLPRLINSGTILICK